MSAFLQQLPALMGVVIGALGSYLAVVRSDRARLRRESEARWEERRLAVYSDYARTVKTSVTLTYRVAAHLGNDPHPHPLTPARLRRPRRRPPSPGTRPVRHCSCWAARTWWTRRGYGWWQ